MHQPPGEDRPPRATAGRQKGYLAGGLVALAAAVAGASLVWQHDRPSPSASTTTPDEQGARVMTKVNKSDAEWRAELTPEQYEVTRRKGTERPSPASFGTTRKTASTSVCAAAPNYLLPTRSSTRTAAGPASLRPTIPKTCRKRRIAPGEWSGPKSFARTAAHTWATCSTTAPSRLACATASTPRRSSLRRMPRVGSRRGSKLSSRAGAATNPAILR